MKTATRLALLAAAGLLAAAQPAPRLSGRFTLTLYLDQPGSGTVAGTVTLTPVAASGTAAATGRFQAPLTTVGLGPDQGPVMAREPAPDSAEVVLNPSARGPRADLAGRWRLGALEGRWRWVGGPARGGRFVLRPAR